MEKLGTTAMFVTLLYWIELNGTEPLLLMMSVCLFFLKHTTITWYMRLLVNYEIKDDGYGVVPHRSDRDSALHRPAR